MDRRSFVRNAVAASAGATAAATAAAMARPLAEPRPPLAAPVPYVGLHKTGGPAPRGVPLVPIHVDETGALAGRPRLEGVPASSALEPDDGAVDVLRWYRYCGHQDAPGLRHDPPRDDTLRYFVRAGAAPWYAARAGEPVRPEHLAPGDAAAFTWRSEGASGTDLLTGVVVRAPPGGVRALDGSGVPPAKPLRREEDRALLRERFLVEDDAGAIVAASTFCTHFCCLPVWWLEARAQAVNKGGEGKVFCGCHDSVYEPFEIALYAFAPEA